MVGSYAAERVSCGASFISGAKAASGTCWYTAYHRVIQVPSGWGAGRRRPLMTGATDATVSRWVVCVDMWGAPKGVVVMDLISTFQ